MSFASQYLSADQGKEDEVKNLMLMCTLMHA
jgi:hypothetical protein